MSVNVVSTAVVGASGYTGDELLRILLRHPGVRITAVTSRQSAGKKLSAELGAAAAHSSLAFENLGPDAVAARADVFFLALPHGVAAEYAVPLRAAGKQVFDLSADFRIKDTTLYKEFYNHDHPAPSLLAEAVYGQPETNREALLHADLVACPGCYPTSCILALAPALQHGWIDPRSICIASQSGVSGAGKKADLLYSYCERDGNIQPYSVTGHRHIPEIEQELSRIAGTAVGISFVPHLAPLVRGMMTTAFATLTATVSSAEAAAAYREFYQGSPFVHVPEDDRLPETRRVARTNVAEVAVRVDERAGRLIAMAAIDNLGKGAAGQAVQAFNFRMGFEETTGLW